MRLDPNFRDPALGLKVPHGFGSTSSDRSVRFGFVDGRVTDLNADIDPAVLRALSTPAGNDPVEPLLR